MTKGALELPAAAALASAPSLEAADPPTAEGALVSRVWEQYRAFASTSRRLKGEQGRLRRWLLVTTVVALLLTPFAKTFERLQHADVAQGLAVGAATLLAVVAWLQQRAQSDDAERPWVRSRQAGEGLKSVAFRFLARVPPFDARSAEVALKRAEELASEAGIVPDAVAAEEATRGLPPAPLSITDYIELRLDDQARFYVSALERERAQSARIVWVGRAISLAVIAFGALAAYLDRSLQDIWTPFLGAVATLATAEGARTPHRQLIQSYGGALSQLQFAKTRWEISAKREADRLHLVVAVEAALATEHSAWVQRLLLKPLASGIAPRADAP